MNSGEEPEIAPITAPRNQNEARRIAAETYKFRCCVICGLQLPA